MTDNKENLSKKHFFGKRKAENAMETNSKKPKIFMERSQSETLNIIQLKSIPIKNKLEVQIKNKAFLNNNKFNSSKVKFKENCLKSALNKNLKKIIDDEKQLSNKLNKLHKLNQDAKINILNELAKKNLDLFHLEALMKRLADIKALTESKKEIKLEKLSSLKASVEFVNSNTERSRKILEDMHTKKLNFQNKILIKNKEIESESEKVFKFIFYIFFSF